MIDTIIKNGRIVLPYGIMSGCIAIQGSKIIDITSDTLAPEANEVINARENLVLPGLIDPHVHLGMFDLEKRLATDFKTESECAAHGGVTMMRVFLQCSTPDVPYISSGILDKAVKWGNENSIVDYTFQPFIQTEGHLDEQLELCGRGITAFKHFYTACKGKSGEWAKCKNVDEGMLFRSFESFARSGYPAVGCVHAEEQDIVDILSQRAQALAEKNLETFAMSRPGYVETMRVESAARIADVTGAQLYIVHLSSREGVDLVELWKGRGTKIAAETCPHYLTHTKHTYKKVGVWGKVIPPLRDMEDQTRLWQGLRSGTIECMGTDHINYTREEKEGNVGKFGDIFVPYPGISAGMATWLPVMITLGVNQGRISIDTLVKVCSENTSRVFGTYPKKGALIPGADADIVVVDPKKEVVIKGDKLHSRSDYSIYEGWNMRGLPILTMVRGSVVMKDGETIGKPGHGNIVPSSP